MMKKIVCGAAVLLAVGIGSGCKQQNGGQKLTSGAWMLKELNVDKNTVGLPPRDTLTLVFDTSGTVAGFSGCNRYFGLYEVRGGDSLKIEIQGSTMAMCPDIETEDKFLHLLNRTTAFAFSDGELTVSDKNTGDYATFFSGGTSENK